MIRRFTVTDGEKSAEGVQFTSGIVVIDRGFPDPSPQAFVSIVALHELNLDARITWIDKESDIKHRCDEGCVCPIHRTPLIYWPHGGDHACQDSDCQGIDKEEPG